MKGKTFLAVMTTVLALALTVLPAAGSSKAANLAAKPTGEPALLGHLTWEGRPAQPNELQSLPVVLTIKETKIYLTLTSGPDGTLKASLAGLEEGAYQWHVKGSPSGEDGPGFLARSGKFEYTGEDVVEVEMGQMKAGDADNDNVVGIADASILRAAYGTQVGHDRYDPRADFDGDGAIGIYDATLLAGNYGTMGDF